MPAVHTATGKDEHPTTYEQSMVPGHYPKTTKAPNQHNTASPGVLPSERRENRGPSTGSHAQTIRSATLMLKGWCQNVISTVIAKVFFATLDYESYKHSL